MRSFIKVKITFALTSSNTCILWNSNSDTSHDSLLVSSQMLTRQDSSQYDPTAKIVCGVKSAHNRATYLSYLKWEWQKKKLTGIHQKTWKCETGNLEWEGFYLRVDESHVRNVLQKLAGEATSHSTPYHHHPLLWCAHLSPALSINFNLSLKHTQQINGFLFFSRKIHKFF